MSITAKCSKGHILKLKGEFAGRKGLCPICKAPVTVPAREELLSEDLVLDLIGPPEIQEDLPPLRRDIWDSKASQEKSEIDQSQLHGNFKICPKCKHEVSVRLDICPHCRTYFTDFSEVQRRINEVCSTCHAPVDHAEIVCHTCGANLYPPHQ